MLGEDLRGRAVTPEPTGEESRNYSANLSENEVSDPIADLLARLAAAADRGTPLSLGRRATVRVRAVPGGFAITRGVW